MRWWVCGVLFFMVACNAEPTAMPPDDKMEDPTLIAPDTLEVSEFQRGAHVTWRDRSSNEESFEIERKTESGAYQRIASVVFDTLQYHDGSVDPGVEYTFRVRAIAGMRASAYSNEATVRMSPQAPGEDAGVSDPRPDAGATPEPDGGTIEPGPVSLANDIVPIFYRTCGAGTMNCHVRDAYRAWSDRDCRGWLSLEDMPLGRLYAGETTGCPNRTLHQRLTELDAWMCDPLYKYVVPGDPAASQLYAVISGNAARSGECWRTPDMPMESMPPVTSAYVLNDADREKIRQWIADGALDN